MVKKYLTKDKLGNIISFNRGENIKVEQICPVPFYRVVATLLLKKRMVTAREVVNFISEISQSDDEVIYEVEDDEGIDCLTDCVEMDKGLNFKIKDKMDYDTVMENGMTVREFLWEICLDNKDDKENIPAIDVKKKILFYPGMKKIS